MKRDFTGKLHKSLEDVSAFIDKQVKEFTNTFVENTCKFEFIIACKFWTNLYYILVLIMAGGKSPTIASLLSK